jgi:hypothetical protein|nr:MAG TPA: hypothetical protein [Caudoviricetes sp.]
MVLCVRNTILFFYDSIVSQKFFFVNRIFEIYKFFTFVFLFFLRCFLLSAPCPVDIFYYNRCTVICQAFFSKKIEFYVLHKKVYNALCKMTKRGGSVSGKKWNKSDFRRDLLKNSQKYFLKLGPNLTLFYPKCYTIIIGGDVCELLS